LAFSRILHIPVSQMRHKKESVTCCSAWAAIIDDGGGVFLLKEGHSTLHAAEGRKVRHMQLS